LDDQIALVGRYATTSEDIDPRTIIEAVSGGWFYLAAIPGNQLIVGFMTCSHLVPAGKAERERLWVDAIARTTLVRSVLGGQLIPDSLLVRDARGSYARTCAGQDWFAIGDARLAPDPLSGRGILWAIEDAVFAA